MWTYQAPLADMLFVMTGAARARLLGAPSRPCRPGRRHRRRGAAAQAGRFATEVLAPTNARAIWQGCTWVPKASDTPPAFRAAYQAFVDGGWPALACRPRRRRPGPAATAERRCSRCWRRQPRLDHVPRPAARRLRVLHHGHRCPSSASAVPAQGGQRRVAGHDVPHRAAGRQRPGPGAHQADWSRRRARQRRAGAVRQQDLHQRRRPRPDRQHRAPGAVPPARCAPAGTKGLSLAWCPRSCPTARATPCSATASSTRWGSTAAPPARCASTGRRLADRRAAPRPGGDVPDDERRPPACGDAGPGPPGGRHAERLAYAQERCRCVPPRPPEAPPGAGPT
jgi:hypothetical protein